jgi:hypothetical protein
MNVSDYLTRTSRINVLGTDVGVGVYYLNPLQLCNLSINDNWHDVEERIDNKFNRFYRLYMVNRLKDKFLTKGDFVMNETVITDELQRLTQEINKPNSRLVWRLFWLDENQEVLDNLSLNLKDIPDIDKWSNHSKAVLYHFFALRNAMLASTNGKHDYDFHLWERVFSYWDDVLNDDSFFRPIYNIIETQGDAGYVFFNQYNKEALKNELLACVLNTFEVFPISIIEKTRNGVNAETSRILSKFIRVLIQSNIGSIHERLKIIKNIISKRIAHEISHEFVNYDFIKMVKRGKYLNLYNHGMKYIDRIKEITQEVYNEAHDQDLHSKTFLSQVLEIQDLHDLASNYFIKALQANVDEGIESEDAHRTFFTQGVLCLRLMFETNLSQDFLMIVTKNLETINKIYLYNQLAFNEISDLNENVIQYVNNSHLGKGVIEKYYGFQYCFFCEGEYAHPDYSIYLQKKEKHGVVTNTLTIFVPRSELGFRYHNNELTKDELLERMKHLTFPDNIDQELREKEKQYANLRDKKEQIEKHLHSFKQFQEEVLNKFEDEINRLNTKQNLEIEQKLQSDDNIVIQRINELEIQKNEKKKQEVSNKINTSLNLENKKLTLLYAGFFAVLIGFGSIVLFSGLKLVFLLLLGFIGLIINIYLGWIANRANTYIKKLKGELRDTLSSIDLKINDCKLTISNLTNKVKKEVEQQYKHLFEDLNTRCNAEIDALKKKFGIEAGTNEDEMIKLQINKIEKQIKSIRASVSESVIIRSESDYVQLIKLLDKSGSKKGWKKNNN